MGFCDSFGHGESVTFGFGAEPTRAVAEVVGKVCSGIRMGSGLGHRLSDCISGTLELGTGLARTIAELVDGVRIWNRKCGCCCVDRDDSQESGVDDGGELHLVCCFVEVAKTLWNDFEWATAGSDGTAGRRCK